MCLSLAKLNFVTNIMAVELLKKRNSDCCIYEYYYEVVIYYGVIKKYHRWHKTSNIMNI